MKNESYRNFMGYLWVQKEDNIYTVGINEDGLEDFESIESVDLPTESEEVEGETICGTVETDEGPLDIYTPVSGKIAEINSAVIEDPSIITEDPYEAWLFKVESDEEMNDSDEDEDEDDDDFDDEDDENYNENEK